ncbi:MAG: class I SAM-dependent methyltransferase [Bacteroidota bacterium]|nr:class I SAM-dependent methyltransferase [Bacteroidota bacterium]MDE2834660.1 class I SAM-dependent methyltransferase [Bacteroidota bacterium]MDE2957199.1 class I SAM-dependent methyltransferase [Bacteroidota bacterium]
MFHGKQFFGRLTPEQQDQLRDFEQLFLEANAAVNLVSRASADRFRRAHLWDCLVMAQRELPAGAKVVDWGTGGGLPAVPLAVVFPLVEFYAVDANRKKHFALRHFVRKLGLDNLHPWHGRAEAFPHGIDYSVSRATADLDILWSWHARAAREFTATGSQQWSAGLLCRKGGDLSRELSKLHGRFDGLMVELIPAGSGKLVHVSRS